MVHDKITNSLQEIAKLKEKLKGIKIIAHIIAKTAQLFRQPNHAMKLTPRIGKMPTPKVFPRVIIAIALPRSSLKYRPIDVTAM